MSGTLAEPAFLPPTHQKTGLGTSTLPTAISRRCSASAPAEEERRVLPWVWLAASLIVMPNLVAAFSPTFIPANLIQFSHALGLVLIPCLLPVAVRKFFLALLPLVALAPATAFYQAVTHSPPREWSIMVLLETNSQEVSQFLVPMVLAGLLVPLLLWVYWLVVTRMIPRNFRLGWRGRLVIVLLGLLLPLRDIISFGPRFGWTAISGRMNDLYPFGTLAAGWKAAQLRCQLSDRPHASGKFTVEAARPLAPGQREIHVLVLGETSRASSFQLNGYPRETNPHLAANPDVISFHDVVAAAPCTVLSVPLLLTPATARHLAQATSTPSFMNVFQRAGYRVHWLSTQRKHGPYDTMVSVFSKDADDALFLSGKLDTGERGRYDAAMDADLVPQVRKILAKNEPRVLLVLHTMGSHMPYHHRYPAEFNHFPAEPAVCESVNSLVTPKAEQCRNMDNAYDNTVRYTDEVLFQLINVLQEQQAVSSLLYVSDHGDNPGVTNSTPYAHGDFTPDILHVPMVLWTSAQFRDLHPDQVAALRSHVDTPFSADRTFHLMVDLAGLKTNLSSPTESVANAGFKPGRRLVAGSLSWIQDYDVIFPAKAAIASKQTAAR